MFLNQYHNGFCESFICYPMFPMVSFYFNGLILLSQRKLKKDSLSRCFIFLLAMCLFDGRVAEWLERLAAVQKIDAEWLERLATVRKIDVSRQALGPVVWMLAHC